MSRIASILALMALLFSCSKGYNGELMYVEPGKDSPFNFPYFLYIPDNIDRSDKVSVVIEPNNSGFADDDLNKHIEKAERIATKDFYAGNYVAGQLGLPLIVPVFPRSKTDWTIYTHALDRDVMAQKGNPLERIDLQLIEMFNDARKRLQEKDIPVEEQFLLTGFSASASFVNRFTLLHPQKVLAVAAGGLNGLLMLPADSLEGQDLPFPLGTADMHNFLGIEFQKEHFRATPQYYFMGAKDFNDAIPYDDAYSQAERATIYAVIGKDMHTERWPACQRIYRQNKVHATFETYDAIGHEQPESVKKKILDFFHQVIAD